MYRLTVSELLNQSHYVLFDWGNTLMVDFPEYSGKMHLWPKVELVAGVEQFLKRISATHQLYVATNAVDSDVDDIKLALQRGGIEHYFAGIFCRQQLGIPKNHADYYPTIVTQLGCDASQVTMIGDTPETDIFPALKHHLNAILVNDNLSLPDDCRAVHCSSFDELNRCL